MRSDNQNQCSATGLTGIVWLCCTGTAYCSVVRGALVIVLEFRVVMSRCYALLPLLLTLYLMTQLVVAGTWYAWLICGLFTMTVRFDISTGSCFNFWACYVQRLITSIITRTPAVANESRDCRFSRLWVKLLVKNQVPTLYGGEDVTLAVVR